MKELPHFHFPVKQGYLKVLQQGGYHLQLGSHHGINTQSDIPMPLREPHRSLIISKSSPGIEQRQKAHPLI